MLAYDIGHASKWVPQCAAKQILLRYEGSLEALAIAGRWF